MPCIGFLESDLFILPAGRGRAECWHFILFQRHTYRWRSLLHHRCSCTMPRCPLTSVRVNSTCSGQVGNSLGQTSFCLYWWLAWWPEKCGWGRAVSEARGRESLDDLVWGGHMQSSETGNLVQSGLHYPASGVGEAGYPFGSRWLFCCCFLKVWIWLRLGKVVIVLWIRGGQGTQRELASQTPSWGSSGDWRRPSLSCWAVPTEMPGAGGSGHWAPPLKHAHWLQGQVSMRHPAATEAGRNCCFSWETLCQAFVSVSSVLIRSVCSGYYSAHLLFEVWGLSRPSNPCLLKNKEHSW